MDHGHDDAIWASLPVAALVLDSAGKVIRVNPEAEMLFNRSARSISEAPSILHLLGGKRVVDGLDKARTSGSAVLVSGARIDRRDAPPLIADMRLAPVASDDARLVACIHSREIEDILLSGHLARRTARSATGMAAVLSHEIKNPLAGIIGAAQLLEMNLPLEDREWTSLIVEESRRILALLGQVEEFGGSGPSGTGQCNIHDVIERTRKLAVVGYAVGLQIDCDFDPSLPAVRGDADQLQRVFSNLVQNSADAVTGIGGRIRIRTFYDPSLRLSQKDGENRAVPIQVEVIDDGPGVPDGLDHDIFEPFVSGRSNGTGLGLAIVSKILSEQGGWIAVESKPGNTVFRVSLPEA